MQISAQIYGLATKNRGQGLAPLLHRIQDKRFTLFRSQKGVRAPRIVATQFPFDPRNSVKASLSLKSGELIARLCADEIDFADQARGHSDLNYPQGENL